MSTIEKALRRFCNRNKIQLEAYQNGGRTFFVRMRYKRSNLAIGSDVVFEAKESAGINPDKFLKRVARAIGLKNIMI